MKLPRGFVGPRLPIAAAMLVVMAMPVNACGFADCNDIGCSDSITFTVQGLPLPQREVPVDVTACFDGDCKTLLAMQRKRVFFADSGSGNGLIQLYRQSPDAPTTVWFELQGKELDDEAEHDVSLRLKVGDRRPITFEDRITMEDTTPENACGDLQCWGAEIDIPNHN